MVKLFSKNVIFMVSGIIAALFVSACLEPVDIEAFLRDDKVQEIINKERVGLKNHTGHTLTAGNEIINGLNPERYYLVEILDEDGDPYTPQKIRYVDESGYLAEDFEDLYRVSGGKIRNLNNDLTYAVYSAPITGNMRLNDQASTPSPGTGTTVTANASGKITPTLQAPKDSYYLELPTGVDPGSDILKFPVAPIEDDPVTIPFETGRIIKLDGEGTTIDYVFRDLGNANEPLKFVKVVIAAEIPPVDIMISVSFGLNGDLGESLTFTPSTLSVSQDTLLAGGLLITVNGSSIPGFIPANTEWWFDGARIHTGASFTMLGSGNIEYLVAGSKEFTVEFVIGAVRYSRILKVVVYY